MTTGFPPCGLRCASKPLLAPCIGEEHRPRPAHRGAGGSRASLAGPSLRPGPASWPSRAVEKATAMTAACVPGSGQVAAVSGRVFRGLRRTDGELMRVSGAIIGASAVPRSRPRIQATAARDTHPDTGTGHADRAA